MSDMPLHLLSCFVVEESLEFSCAHGVLHLPYGLCLNLPDALAGHLEDSAYLLQRIGVAVADSVSQLDNLAFSI